MSQKTVSEAIEFRRSVRIYDTEQPIETNIVKDCIKEATLAPSSSNLQLWEFYHITNPETLKKIATACFGQPAASTALQLVIPVVRKDLWKHRVQSNLSFLKRQFEAQKNRDAKKEKMSLNYYEKTIPLLYKDFFGILGVLKKLSTSIKGFSKPVYRELSASDLRIVAQKSTALAAQTFMISMAGRGYDTCPMEGFDSVRVKKILGLPKKAEISMIIGCGQRAKNGVYGPRFRVPFEDVYRQE